MATRGDRLALRAAQSADVDAIETVVDAAYHPYIRRIGRKPAPMLEDYAKVIRQRQVTVAESEGRIVAVLVLAPTDEGLLLENIAVHPDHHGIGRALVEHAESEARRQGFASIWLYTHEQMTENRAWYARLGYVEYDRRSEDGLARVFFRKRLA